MSIDVMALFFEDIRQEVGNKTTLIGLLANEITVPGSSPAFIPKLAIAVFLRAKGKRIPANLETRLTLPAGESRNVPLPIDSNMEAILKTGGLVQANFLLSPAIIQDGKSYRVELIADGKTHFAGEIRLKVDPNLPVPPMFTDAELPP